MDKIEVTRPISNIEHRTPQEVFDIMCARLSHTPQSVEPVATDVAAQDDTALLEKLADEACKRLGIDPNEIVDPVGPVRKKDDIIYAMYAFAREKFWDTEPNDVAALVEAARALVNALDSCVDLTPNVIRRVEQALAPFTKGQP